MKTKKNPYAKFDLFMAKYPFFKIVVASVMLLFFLAWNDFIYDLLTVIYNYFK
jgi:hypothetical protein